MSSSFWSNSEETGLWWLQGSWQRCCVNLWVTVCTSIEATDIQVEVYLFWFSMGKLCEWGPDANGSDVPYEKSTRNQLFYVLTHCTFSRVDSIMTRPKSFYFFWDLGSVVHWKKFPIPSQPIGNVVIAWVVHFCSKSAWICFTDPPHVPFVLTLESFFEFEHFILLFDPLGFSKISEA